MAFDRNSTLGDVYASPMGHDVIDRLVLQLGRSSKWVNNPLTSRVSLAKVEKVAGRLLGDGFVDALLEVLNSAPERIGERVESPSEEVPWWKEAVFYQIYPRSFADSDGDGVGDLRGIIDHLDYLDDLGVDCLWLSPIFASPNEDNGYDVSDYRAIMDEMGTLDDVDELIAACHERGMRIILDLVVNHTSDQHAWFRAAVADPDGPYGEYYYVRPGSPDAPPNNWTSFFSGPAWRWLEDSRRWVLHLFAQGQVDLNWENPQVRREVADIVQWWLARGIDGFRLDVINYISKRDGLPDGNRVIGELMGFVGVEHYFHGPRVHDYLAELRREGFTRAQGGESGPGRDPVGFMVGEMPGIGGELGRLFTAPERGELDLIFSFDALETSGHVRWDDYRYDLNYLKEYLIAQQERLDDDEWVSLFQENHDNPRMISKVNSNPQYRTQIGKMLATLLLAMRGTPFIYQGQEIGAINQDFGSIDDIRDIESLNRYAETREWRPIQVGTRDHARTPMRWDSSPGHGFTTGKPWIGFHEESVGFTVAEQSENSDSVLGFYRSLIALRRENPALTRGAIHFVGQHRKNYFAWFREYGQQWWFVEINLSERAIPRPYRDKQIDVVLGSPRAAKMRPYEVVIGRVVKAS